DFTAATDLYIQMTPADFGASLLASPPPAAAPAAPPAPHTPETCPVDRPSAAPHPKQAAYAKGWISANDAQHTRIESVAALTSGFEGAFVHTLLDCLVPGSLLFSASSMAIRALDTFYAKRTKQLCVLCNRGLNGIDGTLSTALGAAQHFAHATFLTGDLTLLHDLPALALQQEMLVHQAKAGYHVPQVAVVLLNNQGGGIFDTLPQKSDEDYFERLFITPQTVDFAAIAAGFHIPHAAVETTEQLEQAYAQATAVLGISLIEIAVPLAGVAQRYAPYQ
ncbi:MAG: thiamine pyrophosphate-binding protein, partial [Raoultibacter sp.]